MIDDTIARIEERIKSSAAIKEENRAELLRLLGALKAEIASLPESHTEKAQVLADTAHASAQEATREDRNPEQLNQSIQELSGAATAFEASHPGLVQTVNSICVALANLGI